MKTDRESKGGKTGQGSEPASVAGVSESRPSLLNLRWFTSKTVRHAAAMRKHVHRILCAQRDLLSPQAVQAVTTSLDELNQAIHRDTEKAELLKHMEKLEDAASKWLKPYPHHAWRENVEVFLVALAVAMGIRTFFAQPFKFPTGSMQPTLYGVTSENLMDKPAVKIPTGWTRVREWFAGISYLDVKAKTDGFVDQLVIKRTVHDCFNQCLRLSQRHGTAGDQCLRNLRDGGIDGGFFAQLLDEAQAMGFLCTDALCREHVPLGRLDAQCLDNVV